jgi:regulator of sigma E protease
LPYLWDLVKHPVRLYRFLNSSFNIIHLLASFAQVPTKVCKQSRMDILIMVGQLLLGLSILVGVHELGHLLAAKAFGMRVEKFSIGFPPKIAGFKWGETEYSVGAVPLGGFVKISGMIDESMDKEFADKEPQPYEYRSKPAWQRLIVIMGGIIVNVITGIIIFVGLTYWLGEQYYPARLMDNGIVASSLAQEIGLKTGDKIVAVNGKALTRFDDITSRDVLLGSGAYYTVERGGEQLRIDIPNDLIGQLSRKKLGGPFVEPRFLFSVGQVDPKGPAAAAGMQAGDKITAIDQMPIVYFQDVQQALSDKAGKTVNVAISRKNTIDTLQITVTEQGRIGFAADLDRPVETAHFGFWESVPHGATAAFGIIADQIRAFGKIFKRELRAEDSLGGPILMAQMFGATWDWVRFWRITGALSMVLAFMNFLPIPALDGGHVMFILFEMVSGRKPSDKFMGIAQQVGMILLLSLMVFAFYVDIAKIFR